MKNLNSLIIAGLVTVYAAFTLGCSTAAVVREEKAVTRAAKVQEARDIRAKIEGRLGQPQTEKDSAIEELLVARNLDGTPGLAVDMGNVEAWWAAAKRRPGAALWALLKDGAKVVAAYLGGDWLVKELNDSGENDDKPRTVVRDNSGPVVVPENASAVIERNTGPVEVRNE